MGVKTKADWLRECPHQFIFTNMSDEVYDWLADNVHPNDWQGFDVTPKTMGRWIPFQKPAPEDLIVLRNSKDAMQFKLAWWNPNARAA